jgi:hypothetical protein
MAERLEVGYIIERKGVENVLDVLQYIQVIWQGGFRSLGHVCLFNCGVALMIFSLDVLNWLRPFRYGIRYDDTLVRGFFTNMYRIALEHNLHTYICTTCVVTNAKNAKTLYTPLSLTSDFNDDVVCSRVYREPEYTLSLSRMTARSNIDIEFSMASYKRYLYQILPCN